MYDILNSDLSLMGILEYSFVIIWMSLLCDNLCLIITISKKSQLNHE